MIDNQVLIIRLLRLAADWQRRGRSAEAAAHADEAEAGSQGRISNFNVNGERVARGQAFRSCAEELLTLLEDMEP